MEGFGQYFHSFAHATQNCSQFPRAGTLTIKRVVDHINQGISRQLVIPADLLRNTRAVLLRYALGFLPAGALRGQAVEVSIKRSYKDTTLEHGRRGTNIVANLQFG